MKPDPHDVRTQREPLPPGRRTIPSDRLGITLAVGLILVGVVFVGSYLLGERYQWRGWQFVLPFAAAAGFALVFGVSMSTARGFAACAAVAAVSILAFRLGLDAGHSFDDPAIRQGFGTWVMLSLVLVPVAWLIGIAIKHTRRRHTAGPSGP